MQITIYGIRNCSTMKKAFTWLQEQQVDYHFHDYQKAGVPLEALQRWVAALGWEALINRKGTTWRRLSEDQRQLQGDADALALMQAYPSVIRRPILDRDGQILVGFSPEDWAARMG
ncbi:ArsC family reductase [Acidithiobacillus sp. IBUN Pt1247-S3]|uniref:ArsC family reductase n=1 Tax=Acidithiobacillus sp. IBUN Pt1247-S3 TaxID=3166642 RepID=UPI0034E3937B